MTRKYRVLDLPVPKGARLISWRPKTPPIRLSDYETIIDTILFVTTTLRQLDAHLRGQYWLSGNWGLQGLLGRLEACGCVVGLDDPRRAQQ
jgi:hypothetical protein